MLSFLISLFAVWIATRSAAASHTYGYHRYEVIGALLSVGLVWVLTGILIVESIARFIKPEPVNGQIMFVVALLGLCVNLCMMQILHQGGGSHHGHSHDGPDGGHGHVHGGAGGDAAAAMSAEAENINVRAAYIHVLGDLVQSIGVLIASVIIWAVPSANLADPICTFVFAILVLYTTVGVLRSALGALLNAVPASVDMPRLVRELQGIRGVSNVHDLHVWSFGPAGDARTASLSVHLTADQPDEVLREARAIAATHGLTHTTIQVERCGTEDVAGCDASGCEIDVYAAGAAPPQSFLRDVVSAVLGRSPNEPPAGPFVAQPLFRVRTPAAGYTHVGLDGTSHAVTPIRMRAPGSESGHGHAHGGAACDGGHGHAHGASAAPASPRRVPPPALATGDDDGAALAAAMGLSPRVPGVVSTPPRAQPAGGGHSHGGHSHGGSSDGGHSH